MNSYWTDSQDHVSCEGCQGALRNTLHWSEADRDEHRGTEARCGVVVHDQGQLATYPSQVNCRFCAEALGLTHGPNLADPTHYPGRFTSDRAPVETACGLENDGSSRTFADHQNLVTCLHCRDIMEWPTVHFADPTRFIEESFCGLRLRFADSYEVTHEPTSISCPVCRQEYQRRSERVG